jgi:hypothetical protein
VVLEAEAFGEPDDLADRVGREQAGDLWQLKVRAGAEILIHGFEGSAARDLKDAFGGGRWGCAGDARSDVANSA